MNAIAPLVESTPVECAKTGVPHNQSPSPSTEVTQPSLLNCVALAMQDPSTDVAKLEMLIRLQREIIDREARQQFVRAMRAAQAEMQPILRTAQNSSTNSRYAPLEVIDAAIRPIYTRHGFCMEFNSEPVEGGVRLICELTHDGGHMKTRSLEAALDSAGPQGKANKTPVQALVSSTTYLRRTLTCLVWNLAMTNEDTDGNQDGRAVRGADGRLTEAQVEELWALMTRTQTQESKFLAAMAPKLRSVSQAPASDFPRLRNALLTKVSMLEQRAAAARAAAARQPMNGAAR